MNELIVLGILLAFMAVGYLLVYPKARGISQLRFLDVIFSLLALATVGALYWVADPGFWLCGFTTNWFVFSLVAYILLETPAWYFYMKKHPHQGDIAQLYGLRPASEKKMANNINTVMHDTKWDAIRTSRAQQILVALGVLSLVAAPTVFWFEDFIQPGFGILAVIPIFLVWWLLRISVRLVADAPAEYLDEFQVRQRDRTYLYAFRIIAAVVSALAIALLAWVMTLDFETVGEVDYYSLELTFGQVNAVIWLLLGSIILVPNIVLAWNQSKAVKS